MTGADRVALYMTAMESGLRWAELRSLTRASFNLDATPATATVEAGYSKHRRADMLPLRPATADALRAYLSLRLPDARAFPMPKQKRGAAMIRADLEAARAKWLEDPAADPAERERRAKSDALKYVDSAGRYADFHGTRHTFRNERLRGAGIATGGARPGPAQREQLDGSLCSFRERQSDGRPGRAPGPDRAGD